jgi:branched-chain amino acid transport system substrate-binding protein
MLKQYQAKAGAEGVDALGYYMAPWAYAQMQVVEQAVEATKGLDQDKLADYIAKSTFKTVLGDVKFGADGEWAESRVLLVQFQHIKDNSVDTFKDMDKTLILYPAQYKTGELAAPYQEAKTK